MSRHLPIVRRATLVVVALLCLSSCTPRITLAGLDHKLYGTSLASFDRWWRAEQAAANDVSVATIDRWLASSPARLDGPAARRRPYDVSTDLCSSSPDTGPGFDFRIPCIRHDFAWRNLKRLRARNGGGIDTHVRRLAATRQFLADMQQTCNGRGAASRLLCRSAASTYYAVVAAVS